MKTQVFPNFVIAGAARGGTTSLLNYLEQHPNVFVAESAPHFFDINYFKGLNYYSQLFSEWNGEKAIGEKTAAYMSRREVPERIYECNPDMKLIFLLRDPVRRAYSHYLLDVCQGREFRSFEDTIRWELNPKKYVRFLNCTKYLERGKFDEHIERYLEYFDKENMLFIIAEKFFKDVSATLKKVFNFLNIEDYNFIDEKPQNVGSCPKSKLLSFMLGSVSFFNLGKISCLKKPIRFLDDFNKTEGYPPMKDEAKEFLREYYRPHCKKLSKIIGINCDIWGQKKEHKEQE